MARTRRGIRNNERRLDPIFTEKPFIRPMSRKGQLQSMIRYVQMNPQRLATKRLKPGYFYVQHDVEIGGRTYEAVGNIKLLQAERIVPVVRRPCVLTSGRSAAQPTTRRTATANGQPL